MSNGPKIAEAALMIAYDNGMINRIHSNDEFVVEYTERLKQFTDQELEIVEIELTALSVQELETVCCGEESESKALCSELAHRVLNAIFE